MKLTFLGHSTIYMEISGKKIIFDPFISPNELAAHINVDEISVDYIFLSHGHFDHLADAESIAKRTGAKIISNYEITTWYEGKGCKNVHPLNVGGNVDLGFAKVKYVAAVHSSTLPDGSNGGVAGGFVFDSNEGNFYYAGDTALTLDMQLIPMQTKLDWALLPIGDNFTMGIDDAVLAAEFVEVDKVVAMHFDTFGYIKIDQDVAKNKFKEADKELIILEVGAEIVL